MPQEPRGFTLGAIDRLKNGETGFIMSFVGSEIPISSGLRPTLLLGQRTLVLASTPTLARQARDLAESQRAAGSPPGDPLGTRLDWLPRKLTMLSVGDTAGSVYPELIVGMPGFVESIVNGRRTQFFQGFMNGFPFVQEQAVGFVGGLPEIPPSPPKLNPAPKFDAELVPDPDDLRRFLFPSVFALSVDDAEIRFISREAIPTLNPSTAVPIGLAALVPAVSARKLASDRARASANLKRIAIAFQEFHDVRSHFPADIRTRDGKPVLSWRVAILPSLGHGELFKEFHLDEPWDSPHNKPLIAGCRRLHHSRRERRASRPDVLPRVFRRWRDVRPQKPRRRRDRRYPGRHIEHHSAGRSQGGRALDQARKRHSVRKRPEARAYEGAARFTGRPHRGRFPCDVL